MSIDLSGAFGKASPAPVAAPQRGSAGMLDLSSSATRAPLSRPAGPSSAPQAQAEGASPGPGLKEVQALAWAQTQCCLHLLTWMLEQAVRLPGLLREMQHGGKAARRVGTAANIAFLLASFFGAAELGSSSTSHIVNASGLLLSGVAVVVESELPHLDNARARLLLSAGLLETPLGLAIVHVIQGLFALALWHDHSGQGYLLAGCATLLASAVALLDLHFGWSSASFQSSRSYPGETCTFGVQL
mmetsp:Transcript_21484/g.47671  ORF Transcript_21484/g.47671 Transcript_21484/m.47671 type:complete len:244 (+) Transcript_21484:39-770(+)